MRVSYRREDAYAVGGAAHQSQASPARLGPPTSPRVQDGPANFQRLCWNKKRPSANVVRLLVNLTIMSQEAPICREGRFKPCTGVEGSFNEGQECL